MPEPTAKSVYRMIASAFDYLHNKKVAHRDMKTENVLMMDKKRTIAKVTDFGFSTTLFRSRLQNQSRDQTLERHILRNSGLFSTRNWDRSFLWRHESGCLVDGSPPLHFASYEISLNWHTNHFIGKKAPKFCTQIHRVDLQSNVKTFWRNNWKLIRKRGWLWLRWFNTSGWQRILQMSSNKIICRLVLDSYSFYDFSVFFSDIKLNLFLQLFWFWL